MLIRIGLPKTTGALATACEHLEAPALVSATCMWDGKRFRKPGMAISQLDIALDSAGFVAMNHFGCFPWTVPQYVELAGMHPWDWWAQLDLCCEPELAEDNLAVITRVYTTSLLLRMCREQADAYRQAGADWLTDPMPVLQGWHPGHYEYSADLLDQVTEGRWPDLVGIGSVCRRDVASLVDLVEHLDKLLPAHTKLHLFGVKGAALKHLRGFDRVESVDSQAWGFAARKQAYNNKVSCTIALKKAAMKHWYTQQEVS